eukprot:SAG31_NODE_6704_length_1917_cov_2.030803_1_plen_44_part_10
MVPLHAVPAVSQLEAAHRTTTARVPYDTAAGRRHQQAAGASQLQ